MIGTESRLFCFGLGYSARVFARHFAARGGMVAGTRRPPGSRLSEDGWPLQPFDRITDWPTDGLAAVTHLLISIPPDEEGDPVIDLCRDSLLAASSHLQWIGYLSTTGVYGDHGGGWVDEDTLPAPTSVRSQRRLAAERQWLALADQHALPVSLFRLAGIYGPGRNVIEDVLAGDLRSVIKDGQTFSRIHVEDIALVLLASVGNPQRGRIYNVCDDEPARPDAVLQFACDLVGTTMPPPLPFAEAAATMSPMARSFWADNKRVRNRRLHEELAVALRYPTYREGLTALWRDRCGQGSGS